MEAIILAGGKAERLGDAAGGRPKALVPIAGARESFPRTAQLLVKITPHQAGSVRVEGIDLTYRDGIRRGTVHTGITATTTTN